MRFWRVLAPGATGSEGRATGSVLGFGACDGLGAASAGIAAGELPLSATAAGGTGAPTPQFDLK